MSAQLPHDPEAERIVIGGMILGGTHDAFLRVAGIIGPDDFYLPKHRILFRCCQHLASKGDALDLVTIKHALEHRKQLEEAGGTVYLSSLIDGLPRLTNIAQWAHRVKRESLRRKIVATGELIRDLAEARELEPDAVVEQALGSLIEIARAAQRHGFSDNTASVKRYMERAEAQMLAEDGIVGLRTGIIEMDRLIQGILAGDLGLVCGRLGEGKSVLLLQIAQAIIKAGVGRVAFFSLEMPDDQLQGRRLSAAASVSFNRLWALSPDARAERWDRAIRATPAVTHPEFMIHQSAQTVAAIRANARIVQAEHGLAAVIVDYLQLVRPSKPRSKRNEEVAEIARDLKDLAMSLGVPVIAACQLNREADRNGKEKPPSMSHIADSDEPGRACDWSILIHRDPPPRDLMKLKKCPRCGSRDLAKGASETMPAYCVSCDYREPRNTKGLVDLILAKLRRGPGGTVRLAFSGHFSQYATPQDMQSYPAPPSTEGEGAP